MKTEYRKWISRKTKSLREKLGLSQRQMADKLEIKPARYQAYEDGRAEPSLMMVEIICCICAVSIEDFFQDSPFSTTA